jgi:hypothetical protein
MLRTYACDELVVEVACEVCAHDYCAVISTVLEAYF